MLCSNSTRKSFRLNNSSAVELPPIMGSLTAVNARDDRPGVTFMYFGGPKAHVTLCSNSTRKSLRLNNSSGVELPPIMGSRTAVNARDDLLGGLFSNLLVGRESKVGKRQQRAPARGTPTSGGSGPAMTHRQALALTLTLLAGTSVYSVAQKPAGGGDSSPGTAQSHPSPSQDPRIVFENAQRAL